MTRVHTYVSTRPCSWCKSDQHANQWTWATKPGSFALKTKKKLLTRLRAILFSLWSTVDSRRFDVTWHHFHRESQLWDVLYSPRSPFGPVSRAFNRFCKNFLNIPRYLEYRHLVLIGILSGFKFLPFIPRGTSFFCLSSKGNSFVHSWNFNRLRASYIELMQLIGIVFFNQSTSLCFFLCYLFFHRDSKIEFIAFP